MIRKILSLICAAVLLASLSSCLVVTPPPEDPVDDGSIYAGGKDTQLVVATGSELDVTAIADKIEQLCGTRPEQAPDFYGTGDHEIVVGNTTRTITATALAVMQTAISKLDKTEDELKWLEHFMIYSDGASVAVVWADEASADRAIEYFIAEYLTDASLKLEAGYKELVSIDKLELMREQEAAEREAKYAEIAETLGQDVSDALRNHMSIYDERFYLWLADLYDPGEYDEDGNPLGGGFYYSNSARENEGYLIDLESTAQALGFLTSAGMMSGNYKQMIPEKLQKEMVAFALSCQSSEDGYFYHPQWGTDIGTGRMSRDVGWATNGIIVRFGYKPYWNAPNGVQGQFGEPGISLTSHISEGSRVSAVSKVILAAVNVNKWPQHLRSLENWEAYLQDYASTIHTKSYSIGHTVAEQCGQIKTRDAEAEKNGEATGYAELTLQYFDMWQEETQQSLIAQGKEPNGLWEEDVSYNSLNGLMKISAIYVSLATYFNYAEEAFVSAVEIIMLEDPDINGKVANGSVDVYNPWISVSRIFSILNKSGNGELVQTMRDLLLAQAADMIRATTRKTVKFRKDDGSYGYTWDYSPSKSQGASVAVPNTVEGDINGGTIALTGVTGNMLSALGISGLNIYAPSDLEVFLDRVSGLTHVVKQPIVTEEQTGIVDFEDSDVGADLPSRVSASVTSGSVEIVGGGVGGDRALLMVTVPDKGDTVTVKTGLSTTSDSCYTAEWDIRFSSVNKSASTAMQISLGSMYILTLGVNTDGLLTFGDTSTQSSNPITNSFSGGFTAFEWHHVRVEHYRTVEGGPITLIYVDDELLAFSDNYAGKQSGTMPSAKLDNVKFYALWGVDYSVMLDNVNAEASAEELDESLLPEPPEPFDGYIDFEDSDLGEPNVEGLSTKPNPEPGNSIEVAEDPINRRNQALKITAKPSSTAGNWVYMSAPDEESGEGVHVFETNVYVAVMNKSSIGLQVYLYNDAKSVFAMDMTVFKQAGGVTLTFDEKNSAGDRNAVFLRVDEVIDGYFTLRVEYDPNECVATVTVTTDDGEFFATTDAYYNEVSKSDGFTKAALYTTFGTDAEIYLDDMVTEK